MNRSVWLGWTALLVAVVLIVVALTFPAEAQECVTVPEDRAKVEAKGWEWLGIFDVPFTVDTQLVYYHAGPFTLVSFVAGGCVSGTAFTVGVYRPEVRA